MQMLLVLMGLGTLPSLQGEEAAPEPKGIHLKIQHCSSVRIASARLNDLEGEWYVSGTVELLRGCSSSGDGRLQVTVLDADGLILKEIYTTYFPHPIPSSSRGRKGVARYSVKLLLNPPPGSTVIVACGDKSHVHHPTSTNP